VGLHTGQPDASQRVPDKWVPPQSKKNIAVLGPLLLRDDFEEAPSAKACRSALVARATDRVSHLRAPTSERFRRPGRRVTRGLMLHFSVELCAEQDDNR
jgi:hypothetical protein